MSLNQPTIVSQETGGIRHRQNLMPRLLFISPGSFSNWGETSHVKKIRECFIENDWRVGEYPGNKSTRIEPNHGLSTIKAYLAPVKSLTFVRNMARTMSGYDIIHLFFISRMSFSKHVLPAIILGRFLGKRVVLSYYRNQAEAELESTGRWMLPFFQMCSKIIVSSEYIAGLFAHHGILTEIIPHVLDEHLFRPREIKSVQPKIIVARSLERRNNIACAIEAFGLVKQKYPRTEMVIVGDGPQREELDRLVSTEKLNGITFTGQASLDELSRHFAQADLYVNTSSIDGLPISMLEALKIGVPVVTTGAGGIPTVITDRENGLLVKANDPAGLADRIIELVESPQLAQRLSGQAKRSVKDYSWSQVKNKWLDLYRSLSRKEGRKITRGFQASQVPSITR